MRNRYWLGLGFSAWALGCGASEADKSGGGAGAGAEAGQASTFGGQGTGGSALQAGTGTIGGGSGGGSGGTVASSGADGGGAAGLADDGSAGAAGAAVAPDAELVPTSPRWVLYSDDERTKKITPSLILRDLDTQQDHPANPTTFEVSSTAWSPDQKTFLWTPVSGGRTNALLMVRFTDEGFIPGQSLDGYADQVGNYYEESWDSTSRYVGMRRFGSPTGVELVDVTLGKRLGTIEVPATPRLEFAPKGRYFSISGGTSGNAVYGYASLTADGVSAPTYLTEGTLPRFSHSGTRLYYYTGPAGERHFHYQDLPSGTAKELSIAAGIEKLSNVELGPDDASVLATCTDDSDRAFLVRAYFDGSPRVDLSDPALAVSLVRMSTDREVIGIDYRSKLEIARLSPLKRHALPDATVLGGTGSRIANMIGQHLFYDANGIIKVASVDAQGALHDTAVSKSGEGAAVCFDLLPYVPSTKLVYRADGNKQLVLVDLASDPPAEVGRLTAAADTTFDCPLWRRDDKSFAVRERGTGGYRVQIVKWTGHEPEAPVVALQSSKEVTAFAFAY